MKRLWNLVNNEHSNRESAISDSDLGFGAGSGHFNPLLMTTVGELLDLLTKS